MEHGWKDNRSWWIDMANCAEAPPTSDVNPQRGRLDDSVSFARGAEWCCLAPSQGSSHHIAAAQIWLLAPDPKAMAVTTQ
jgi:hypothetical protein